jgi:hypothetical protein
MREMCNVMNMSIISFKIQFLYVRAANILVKKG